MKNGIKIATTKEKKNPTFEHLKGIFKQYMECLNILHFSI